MDERLVRWIERAKETEGAIRCDSSHPVSIDTEGLLELMLDMEGETIDAAEAIEREACAELVESWKSNDSYFKTGGAQAESDELVEQIAFDIRARGESNLSEQRAPKDGE